jgi:hypothetical protein
MTFVVTLTPTYNSIALAEALHEEKRRNFLYLTSRQDKYMHWLTPSLLIGENLKELPDILKAPKHFFILFNSGNNSSPEVIERANLIIDYTVNVNSPNFSYGYSNKSGKLLLGIENYPFVRTKHPIDDETILVSCKNNAGLVFNWVRLEANLHNMTITNFVNPKFHPKFVVTDVDEIALEYCMNGIPVMQFPGRNPDLYNYLVFNHLTIPFTIENIGKMIANDDFMRTQTKFLKDIFRGAEENIQITAQKIKERYETFFANWQESQRRFRESL